MDDPRAEEPFEGPRRPPMYPVFVAAMMLTVVVVVLIL